MITYRFAVREDIPAILSLVRALAEYEHMEDAVVATPELYEDWLFEKQCARVLLAMDGERAVGFALFFYNFSDEAAFIWKTFLCWKNTADKGLAKHF